MNPERLLQHFDRISEAPDAIPRLLRFILDLAVRGKLVEQDPNDEPAVELLKRIQAERTRLVKEGKMTRLVSFDEEDALFSLPASWCWARFIEVAAIESNLVKPDSFPDYPHIAPDSIEGYTGRLLDYQTIRASKVFSAKHRFFPGHIVYSKIRPNLGKAVLVDFEGLCSADMYPIRPFIDRAFLLKFMLSEVFIQQSVKEDNRVAMPKINQESLAKILVAVPPLAEQHRIIAKVDELMALCDQLEAAKAEREQSRDRLVAVSLHRLNSPADTAETDAPDLPARQADTFRDHARFVFNHLPCLTSRPEHIKQLRQTILNLAVRGKLVPQDPNDEPAVELLKRLQAEKARLADDRAIKRLKASLLIDATEVPSPLPEPWVWVRLGDLLLGDSQNGYSKKPDDAIDGIPILRISAGTVRKDGIVAEEEHKLIGGVQPSQQEQYQLQPGDLLACRFNGNRSFVGRLALYLGYLGMKPIYPDKLIRLRLLSGFVLPKLVGCFAESSVVRRDIEGYCATTVGNWGISASNLKEVKIPLPPLAEQYRIVARVDALMALCDQLEAQLTTTEADSRLLLEAVLHEALNPLAEVTEQLESVAGRTNAQHC